MLLIGIMSAFGLLLLVLKAGGRKAIGADIFVDIAITVTLMVCFYGTYSGMVAAMLGGLCASIVLFIMKKTMEHEVLTVKTNKYKIPKPEWQTVKPNWRD
jgi:fructose-specific phosphotransferase system IIC component|tara:strand:- start:85 stop:384 length:300 start_codon:yes stop_codon:yes gene_type:complete